MYHDAYAGIAVVCMSGIIVIQSGCQGKRHTHIVISFVLSMTPGMPRWTGTVNPLARSARNQVRI